MKISELLEFAPGNGDEGGGDERNAYEKVADFIKAHYDPNPKINRPNLTQGAIRFKLKNGNRFFNRHDEYQVEFDSEEGYGEHHELPYSYRIVQVKPYKALVDRAIKKLYLAPDLVIADLKRLFK